MSTHTVRIASVLVGCVVVSSALTHAGDLTWANPSGGLWTTGANWDTTNAPVAGDNTVIADVATQSADYTVTFSSPNPGPVYGSLTVGQGAGGNAYKETFKVVNGVSEWSYPTFTNLTVNTDGVVWFNQSNATRILIANGGTVANYGTFYGGPTNPNRGPDGVGLVAATGGGTRPLFINRGAIDLNNPDATGRYLAFNGMEFDNTDRTIGIGNTQQLTFKNTNYYPFVYGGTFNVGNGGVLKNEGDFGKTGVTTVIAVATGGAAVLSGDSRTHVYSLENRGAVDYSAGWGIFWSGTGFDNHGTLTHRAEFRMTGPVVNHSGATWSSAGGNRAWIKVLGTGGTFVNDGAIVLGNDTYGGGGRLDSQNNPFTNNGTITFSATNECFLGSDYDLVLDNVGTLTRTGGTLTRLRGTVNNTGTINWQGRLYTQAMPNYALKNTGGSAVIVMNNADFGETRGTDWGFAYIRQDNAGATMRGTGSLCVDALTNGTWGQLTGTLQADGGTLTLKNWTSNYPGGRTTGTYNNAHTLTVAENGRLVADAGRIVTENFTADMLVNGKLGLYNGGMLRVNDVGLTVGATGYIDNNSGSIEMADGNLLLNSTQNTLFHALGTTLAFGGTNQTLGLASQDLGGADSAFFDDNFAFRLLRLTGATPASLSLADGSGAALYLLGLDFTSGMTLDMNDHNVYVKGYIVLPDGSSVTAPYGNPLTFTDGAFGGLLGGSGMLTLSYMPEPSAVLLLALAGVAGLARRPRRRTMPSHSRFLYEKGLPQNLWVGDASA